MGTIIGGVAGGLGAGVANLAAGGGFFSAAALNVTGGFGAGFVSGLAVAFSRGNTVLNFLVFQRYSGHIR